jgi:cell filamentation protein
LGFINQRELAQAENKALIRAYDTAALTYSETQSFTSEDICRLHKIFLGDIYDWAGEYRHIDISSPGIRWCHAQYISSQMLKFDERLSELTPFTVKMDRAEILARSAEIHGELIAIHPFRDGNGRVCRLLNDLLLMQAEMPPMTLSDLDDSEIRDEYFSAIRDVVDKVDYTSLVSIFEQLVVNP